IRVETANRALSLVHASGHALEAVARLLDQVLDDAGVVVGHGEVVVEGGEAGEAARLLHGGQYLDYELVMADRAPVVGGGVEGEAGGEGSVHAHDERVLAGAAGPGALFAAHEALHLLEALDGGHHLVAGAVLRDDPVNGFVHPRPVVAGDVGFVALQVLEVAVLGHGRLVDVVVGGDAAVVGDFGELAHIHQVVAADV